jgi:hypothetical protein
VSINGSPWSLVLDTLAAGSGTSFARPPTNARPCFGCLPERKNFAAGKRGEGSSPIERILSVYDRGHAGKAKIKARLIGDLDPEEWELPPKPKWMRWRTYNRLAERFEVYDDMTYPDDSTLPALVAKLMRRTR